MKDERIEWVDIAKGIGIMCVVMGHIFSSQMLAYKIIYMFHMPLFFYVSGFLYKRNQNKGAYIFQRIRSLVIPYFFVFIFVYLSYFLIYFPKDYPLEYIKIDILYYIQGGRLLREIVDNVFVAMWFITCLFVVQVIYNFIQTMFKPKTVHVIVVALLVGAYINNIFYTDFWFYWCANVALMAIPIYHIGFVSRQFDLDRYSVWFIIGGVLVLSSLVFFPQNRFDMMLNDYGIPIITLICSVISIYMIRAVSMYISRNAFLTKILSELGKASLVIMSFHLPVYALLWKYFEMKSPPAIILIMIIPYCLYYIFNKFKVTQILFLGRYARSIKLSKGINNEKQ